jgi:trk system potassium uptake protein TrkA
LAKKSNSTSIPVLVVGLGRFGTAVAESLVRLGHDVLAVDEQPEIVQRLAGEFTHIVAADTTDTEALKQIGAESFKLAVVGIGTDIEASVLTVMSLVELGVTDVWAKAINDKHAKLLERVGATHVVRPELAMGERVAHLVTGAPPPDL